jgi:LysR family nitrogen assimilation transcriptional regulator
MEFRHLRSFLEIARTGSFSRAASTLAIAQPALSRQIRELEQDLKTPLFHRNGRGVILTAAGEIFLGHAQEIIDRLTRAENEIAAFQGELQGTITLGLPPSVGMVLLKPLITRLNEQFPRIVLRAREGFSVSVSEWLHTGQADLAIVYGATGTGAVLSETLLVEELVLVHHPDLRDNHIPIKGNELSSIPLVLAARPNSLRLLVERRMADFGHSLNIRYEVESMPTIKELVAEGTVATILPYGGVMREVAEGTLQISSIILPHITRSMALATAANRPIDKTMRAVIRVIHEVAQDNVLAFPRTEHTEIQSS